VQNASLSLLRGWRGLLVEVPRAPRIGLQELDCGCDPLPGLDARRVAAVPALAFPDRGEIERAAAVAVDHDLGRAVDVDVANRHGEVSFYNLIGAGE